QRDMTVFLWTRELQEIQPGGTVSLEDPAIWNALRERYRKLHEAIPDVDGLVLSLEDADLSLFDTKRIVTSMDPAARLTKLVDELGAVCREVDWDLWVRTPGEKPDDLEWVARGIANTNPTIGVLTPIVPYKWHPKSPYHPAIGAFPNRRQLVELDLGNLNFGRCLVPYCDPELVCKQLSYALGKGAVGAVARVDCGEDHCLGSVSEISLFAFGAYLHKPQTTVDSIWSDYLRAAFPNEDHQHLKTCLQATKDIIERVFLSQGSMFLNDESRIPDLSIASRFLNDDSLSVWDPTAVKDERLLRYLTSKTAQSLVAEKDEAVARCLEAQAGLERARASIRVSNYIALSSQLNLLEDAARLWRDITDAYCAYTLWKQDPSEQRRGRLALSHNHLSSWIGYLRRLYGSGHPIFDARRLEKLVEEVAPPPPPEEKTQTAPSQPGSRPR
ncbi:MAG: hypothetical protein ABIH23_24105, partial [bacterium]